MAAYPTSPMWSYPVTRKLEFETTIAAGPTGIEQRWPLHAGRESFELSYPRITLAQRDLLLAAFGAAKGSYDGTFTLSFLGTTYERLYLDSDELLFEEREPGVWSATVTLRQVRRTPDTGTLAADFPALTSGARVQYPYTHGQKFDTVAVGTEGGRYSYYNRAASLRLWSAGGPGLSDSEADAIWSMFSRARGRWGSFHFTDPDTAVEYTACRFATDSLERQYQAYNLNSLRTQIQQLVV